jgi:glycosyltransferase involved in cell wall biosynthesis
MVTLKRIYRSLQRVWHQFIGLAKSVSIIAANLPEQGTHVSYGHDRLPAPDEVAHGGIIKFQRLAQAFPNTPRRFNVLYMVSSNHPPYALHLRHAARRKGARFVWNQDGVAYPAWMPSGWKEANDSMAKLLHSADHVFYQSEFSRSSSDQFLGHRAEPSEVLYNAVDTDLFRPARGHDAHGRDDLVLLTAGSKYLFHRIESAIRTLAWVLRSRPRTRLVFAGKLWDRLVKPTHKLIAELHVEDHVAFLPPFTQEKAPGIFQGCDILLHPKINDPCPGIVIEAMACGLPVVYSDSGGTPELVGEDAGIGVPTEASWERFIPPAPETWTEAILTVAEDLSRYGKAARQRAVDRFDLRPWIERHRQVFSELLDRP